MKFVALLSLLFLAPGWIQAPLFAQPADTSAVDRPASRLPAGHHPEGALWRSLAIPGWGQVYNRQFWKLPLVYAGLGGTAALAVSFGRQHRLYTRAFQWKAWEEAVASGREETNPFPEFEDEYRRVVQAECGGCEVSASAIKPLRDNFRRNRDLSLFGIGLVYGLSTLDAFISAHLLDFDVSEDLTIRVLPHPEGFTALVRIGL